MSVTLGDFGQRWVFGQRFLTTVLPEAYFDSDDRFSEWQVNDGHRLVVVNLDVAYLHPTTELGLRLQLEQPNGSGVDVGVSPPVSTPGPLVVLTPPAEVLQLTVQPFEVALGGVVFRALSSGELPSGLFGGVEDGLHLRLDEPVHAHRVSLAKNAVARGLSRGSLLRPRRVPPAEGEAPQRSCPASRSAWAESDDEGDFELSFACFV